MSDAVAGQCRSGDCTEPADVYAFATWRVHKNNPHSEKWEGEFCYAHFARVLPVKLLELPPNVAVRVLKLKWEVAEL